MPIAKHLIVENGVLKTTDKPKPVEPKHCGDICKKANGSCFGECHLYLHDNPAFESWKQEALVAENNSVVMLHRTDGAFTIPLHDGIYDAPAGLEYEVKEQFQVPPDSPWYDADSNWSVFSRVLDEYKRKVAILSFASPKEEQKQNLIDLMKTDEEFGMYETTASKEKPEVNLRIAKLIDGILPPDGIIGGDREKMRMDFMNEILSFLQDGRLADSKDIEKPDFEEIARNYAIENYSGTEMSDYVMSVVTYSGHALMKYIWNTHVGPEHIRAEYWEDAHGKLEEKLKGEIAALQEENRQLKPPPVCITCSVPLDVHGTCCGWINAQIKINESGIIIDPRHPGYCLDINTWRNREYDKYNNKHA